MIDQIEDAVAVHSPPWETVRHGVVSLLEMQEFYADIFAKSLAQLAAFELKALDEDRNNWAKPDAVASLYAHVGGVMTDAAIYGLDSVGMQCSRLMKKIQDGPIKCGEIRDDLHNLRTRFEDEFGKHLFIHLTLKEAEDYRNPEKNWDEVISRFSKMRYNIEESGKCFALNRYGAAVFHVLQVAEYGVVKVAELLKVGGDKPGWGSLKRLKGLLDVPYPQREALAQKHTKLLENVVPLALVVKDSWRHKLDHVDNQIIWVDTDFSPLVAGEIISATRAFMRKLALELPR